VLSPAGFLAFRHFQTEYRFRAAEKARLQRDFVGARSYLDQCLEVWPESTRIHLLLARIARQTGLYEEAERRLDICQKLEGNNDTIALERALLQVQQGAFRVPIELDLRQRVKDDHPDATDILEALGRGCMSSFRLNDALGYLSSWLERDPLNVQAHLWRAKVYEQLQDLNQQIADTTAALQLAPNDEEAQYALAQALLSAKRVNEAMPLFADLWKRQPQNPLAAMGLAQCLSESGEMEQAQQILDGLAARFPREAGILRERGKLALRQGKAAEARPWLEKAAALAPSDYYAQYSLWECLGQLGEEEAARACEARWRRLEAMTAELRKLTSSLQQHPYDLSLRCQIAKIFLERGMDAEGILWLKDTLKIDATDPETNRLLAEYYEQSGQPSLAAPYRKALQAGGVQGR
jgi:thioredoxin-like negative regulator of GroEL